MKKLLFFIIVAIAQVNTLQADDVSVEQALQVARQFAIERSSRSGMQKAPSAIAPSLAYTVKSLQNNDTHNEASLQNNDTHNNVYVINLGEEQGFVVVSGETGTTAAVLGYCDQGTFSYDDAPCNLKALLQQYAGQIDCLRENRNLTPRSSLLAPRSSSSVIGNVVVEPFVTTKWNQGTPFNDLCPMLDGKTHTVTGCTATAMAQIMAYWKYPRQGRGQHSYTYYPGVTTAVTYSADFSQSFYDWDNMLDNYDGDYTDEQGAAVALLMKDAGYAVDSRWGSGSLGTGGSRSPEEALAMNFDYNPDSIRTIGMGDANFIEQLKRELDARRPIFFSAHITWYPTNAHAMVIDGYTDNDYFHVNFGWSGDYDGYYLLTNFYNGSAIVGILPARSINLNGLYFTTAEQTATLSYSDVEGVADVPETIEAEGKTYTVESVAKKALLENTKTTQINLPGTIKSIGERAFYNCTNLTAVTAPQKSDLGYTSNSLPESLTTMGEYAFGLCKNLKNITLPSSLERVPDYAFYWCEGLEQVIIRSKTVGVMAFCTYNRDLNLRVYSYAEELCDSAFFNTVVKQMYFYNTKHIGIRSVGGLNYVSLQDIETIGECQLTGTDATFMLGPNAPIQTLRYNSPFSGLEKSIIIDSENSNFVCIDNVVYNKAKTELMLCPKYYDKKTPWGEGWQYSSQPRYDLEVPATVKRIQDFALIMTPLIELTIPATVEEIGVFNIRGGVNVYNYATTPQPIHLMSELHPLHPYHDAVDAYLSTPLTGTLHVPAGCKEAYAAADVWKNFSNIVDDLSPMPTGIEEESQLHDVRLCQTERGIDVTGLAPHTTVALYSPSGILMATATATADGRAKIDLPTSQAIYILKVGEATFKLRTKK